MIYVGNGNIHIHVSNGEQNEKSRFRKNSWVEGGTSPYHLPMWVTLVKLALGRLVGLLCFVLLLLFCFCLLFVSACFLFCFVVLLVLLFVFVVLLFLFPCLFCFCLHKHKNKKQTKTCWLDGCSDYLNKSFMKYKKPTVMHNETINKSFLEI